MFKRTRSEGAFGMHVLVALNMQRPMFKARSSQGPETQLPVTTHWEQGSGRVLPCRPWRTIPSGSPLGTGLGTWSLEPKPHISLKNKGFFSHE